VINHAERAGESGGDSTRPPRRVKLVDVVRWVLIVLVLAATAWQIVVNWQQVVDTVTQMQWHRVALAFVALLFGIASSTASWSVLVDELGNRVGPERSAEVFLVGALGKYLPGSVWAYVLQLELGHRSGIARARVFTATVFNLAVILVAALVAGGAALPALMHSQPELSWLPWLYLVLPPALVMLHPRILTAITNVGFRLLKRPLPDHPVRLRAVGASLGFAILTYAFYGAHLWLLADTRQGLSLDPLLLCIGTMAIAMIGGLMAFLLPSGIGAREFIIVAALGPMIGVGAATAYAAVSRLMFVLVDLVAAGAASLVAWIARRKEGEYRGDPGIVP